MVIRLTPAVDLLGSDFEVACAKLGSQVEASFQADLYVGILRGGDITLEMMLKGARPARNYEKMAVSMSRAHTETKNKLNAKFKILPLFPRAVLNLLRQAEAWLLDFQDAVRPVQRRCEFSPVEIEKVLRAKRILVVDDAVDSGATLESVINGIKAINPEAEIKSAVITKTRLKSRVNPEFMLYERTFVRFPWSSDACSQ